MRDGGLRFRYAVARELGMTVAQLDATMTGDELIHWRAFFKLENDDMESKRKKSSKRSDPDDDD